MSAEETILIRPDYVVVYPTHPAYPLLVKMRETEARLVSETKARMEWQGAFQDLAEKMHRVKRKKK